MDWTYVTALVVAACLAIYLIIAMLIPERFS